MKKIILLIPLLAICLILNSQDFRNAKWGMTLNQVKQTEPEKPVKETSELLAYKTNISNFETFAIYIFVGDKLTRAKYALLETHSNKNDYITDYNTLKSLLNKKYGNSIEDVTRWKNDLYKENYSDWGFAVSLGHLLYYSSWKTDRTEIFMCLSGENYEIENIIEYTSLELITFEDELRDKNELDNFSINGFGNCNWGVSKSTVKTKEIRSSVSENNEILAYETKIAGVDMLMGYIFTNDKLTSGRYLASEKHTNKNDYITDYNSLKEILDKKYGSPKESERFWKNELYKENFSDWGFAISLGHLVYFSKYEIEKSEITIMLSGENYEISLIIDIKSKEFKELENTDREKNDLKNL